MDKIRLQILGLSSSQSQSDSFALILEEEGSRRLPIIIGRFEAQAIAIEMEKVSSSRPMTHDLFTSLGKQFQFSLKETIISDLREGVFYAEMIYSDERDGKTVIVDARPSDAIAISLRFGAPIYTTEKVMSEAGIVTSDTESSDSGASSPAPVKKESKKSTSLNEMSKGDLEKALEAALGEENYEKAAQIRDEINRRN